MSKYNRGLTKEEIEKISEEVVGKTFGELGKFKYNLDDFNYKGGMGVLMEENVFQYEANSDANPDFYEAKIELKVTPVKKNKNGTYSAKERLVLNIINYMEEYKNTFETSSFWHKNENLNLMFYLWEEGVPRSDYKIIKHLLYTYPEEDLLIIKQDWEVIVNKIRNGLAHEISEADTLYLGACTKGVNKESVREQPFSEILAKQRAYCLKTSYMTNLVRTRVMDEYTESLISAEELQNKTFEESLYDKIKSFIGKSKTELINKFGLNPKSKDVIERIFAKMLGIKGKVNDTDEFQKANITCKTIRMNEDNTITESMSFPAFKYKEIIQEEWDTSTLRNIFSENKYLFVIFKEKNNEFYFSGIKLWNMPLSILDNEVKSVWDKTVEVIKSGNIVKSVGKTRKTNFPGMKENNVAHVRPHGRNSKDVFELPVADKLTGCKVYTKHCFWLKNKYIESIII